MVLASKATCKHSASSMQDSAMPAIPDWNVIRELYNKGMPLKEIAKLTGVQQSTIASRACRGNWKRTAAKADAIAQSVSITVQGKAEETPESNAIAKASETVKGSLANALLQATGCLDTLPTSKSLKSRSASAQLLSTLAGVGKTVFGWSEGQSQPSVRINVLSSFAIAPVPDQQPVIDVTSTPVITDSESSASDTKPQ